MALKISHRAETEVPRAGGAGTVNPDLMVVQTEMAKLTPGMVLVIEVENPREVRGTKLLISKASKQLGTEWKHWHSGTVVYAKPAEAVKRRGRRKKSELAT